MKNKKGFTLVELLAVIAILGVILLLIVPNIVDMFNEGKKDTFIRQVQSIWKEAEKEYETDLARGRSISAYCDSSIEDDECRELSLNTTDIKYVVTFDSHGKVTMIGVQDKNYCFTTTDISSMDISHDSLAQKGSLACDQSGCSCSRSSEGGSSVPAVEKFTYLYYDGPMIQDLDLTYDEFPVDDALENYDTLEDVFFRVKTNSSHVVQKQEACIKYHDSVKCFGPGYASSSAEATLTKLTNDVKALFGSDYVDCYSEDDLAFCTYKSFRIGSLDSNGVTIGYVNSNGNDSFIRVDTFKGYVDYVETENNSSGGDTGGVIIPKKTIR